MKKIELRVEGMDCAEEISAIRQELNGVAGVLGIEFDLLGRRLVASIDEKLLSEASLVEAVNRSGVRAVVSTTAEVASRRSHMWGRMVAMTISGVAVLLGFLVHAAGTGVVVALAGDGGVATPVLAQVLYGTAVVAGAWFVAPKAWASLRRLRPDMNLLMVVAVIGAVGIGEWFEAATVAFLFAASLVLEAWSIGRARRAITALLSKVPEEARLLGVDGTEQLVPVARVPVASRVLVKPGERIPLDGRVAQGSSEVNQAPITGESVPVLKGPGDVVFAGTVNGDAVIEIVSTTTASDSTLSRIIRMVGEAHSQRAPVEQWVEKFASVYTPVVMALALATVVLPPALFGGSWSEWLYRSLVLLVIACPCALVISTPVSIVAALAAAARNGVLVKGGVHIETPAHLRAVAIDKTGTLTEGRPRVVAVVPMSGHDERELLERVAALESRSTHPLAQAIVAFAEARNVAVKPATDVRIIQGKGAVGFFDGQEYWLGSHRYLEERGGETPEIHAQLEGMSRSGQTVVVVGDGMHVCGFIALADAVRPAARATLLALRAAGVQHIVMLTGDNRGTADSIAKETGVDEVHAELLPADKVAAIERLVTKYGNVAMIGDGVNDAPAMARATLGIAMGAAGSDAAIETADVALMSDDLSKVPWLVLHSRRTLRVIRQNIVLSLGVKALFLGLTLVGYASLWAAIAADMGASFLVIVNGLRLLNSGGDNTLHERTNPALAKWKPN
jgi:Zn2+/Cd2+-exporting ATPase